MTEANVPSLSLVLDDLRALLSADARRITTAWGVQRSFALIGKAPPTAARGFITPSLARQPWEILPDMIDLTGLPATHVVEAMYAYATEGRHPLGITTQAFSDEVETIEDLALSHHSDLYALFLRDTPRDEGELEALSTLCLHTRARLDLDLGEDIGVEQLALLAQMAERSIRNAVSAPGEDQRLKLLQHGLVSNVEARRWLKGRRSFRPTVVAGVSQQPGEHPDRLTALMDLGRYIEARWVALNKNPEAVRQELNWSEDRLEYLEAITSAPHLIDPRDCGPLAQSLQVATSWFTEQVMRLLYPHQMELLLPSGLATMGTRVNATAEIAPPNNPSTVQKLDISSRLVFVMSDGSQWFPARMKNRETGLVAFRLSEGGAGGNTKDVGVEVNSEDEMIRLVVQEGYAVRMTSGKGGAKSLFKLNGRWEGAAYLDGKPVPRAQ